MQEQWYRLRTPTLVVLSENCGHKPITVPEGGEILVEADILSTDRLVEVSWEGKHVLMFTVDIRERGERLKTTRLR